MMDCQVFIIRMNNTATTGTTIGNTTTTGTTTTTTTTTTKELQQDKQEQHVSMPNNYTLREICYDLAGTVRTVGWNFT